MCAIRRRRTYDKQFKLEAVRLYMEEGLSTKYVEQKLGIGKGVVYDWIKRFGDNSDHTRYIEGDSTQRDNELQKLRRELVRVKRERDILKKAIVIFSKDLYRSTHS
jgi:transposase